MPDEAALIAAVSALWGALLAMAGYVIRDKDRQLSDSKDEIKELK